jgi:hypothetical protein
MKSKVHEGVILMMVMVSVLLTPWIRDFFLVNGKKNSGR